MRIHLFEFEDFNWFPDSIRKGGTDYLRYVFNVGNFYKPATAIISEALTKTGEHEIIDLCSGGGGAIEQIYKDLNELSDRNISITLSDKFPNINAFTYLKIKTKGGISFKPYSVEATSVPKDLKGFRTMFSAAHHFQPDSLKAILQNAIENKAGIGIFDGGDKNIFIILGILILHPLVFLVCTPFFKPFTFSRIFFTYIIPLIPLYTIWDGCISILRLYKAKELLKIAEDLNAKNYVWKSGKVKSRFGMHVTYLVGYPVS